MRALVRKFGNSSGVIIPKPILVQLGVEVGDGLDLSLDGNRIVLAPLKQNPRAEWAKQPSASPRPVMTPSDGLSLVMLTMWN